MEIRDYYFKDKMTLADSDTTSIDLKGLNPLSAIIVDIEVTNGSSHCRDHRIHDDVSLIEVVDGSKVIASLSMKEWAAVSSFVNRHIPKSLFSEWSGVTQKERVILNFGRYIGDPEYYLDVGAFKNPELRIANSFNISDAGGFESGTGKLTVIGKVIDKGYGSQKGFMATKEVRSFTSKDSGEESIPMPVDYPYRFVLLQILKDAQVPSEVISKVKLSCNNDEFVPVNTYMDDLIDLNKEMFGYFDQVLNIIRGFGSDVYLDIYDIRQSIAESNEEYFIMEAIDVTGNKVTIDLYDMNASGTAKAYTNAKRGKVFAVGNAPFGGILIPFGDIDNPEGWLKANDFDKIDLKLTQQAEATVNVIVQQVMS